MVNRTFWVLFTGCFYLGACRRDDIQTYTVRKESSPSVMAPAASAKEIDWKVPEGWQERAPSSVRVGSFLAKGPGGGKADISVVPLSGEAGGDLSNINRWRGQISLAPITEADLSRQSERVTAGGKKMVLVNMANQGKRLVAAIYHEEKQTWFFKMTGDDETVQASEPAFRQFLQSVKIHGR